MKKSISLLCAFFIIISTMTGCGENDEIKPAKEYKINDNLTVTTIPVTKKGNEMTEEEIIPLANDLIEKGNLIWKNLFLDQAQYEIPVYNTIERDGQLYQCKNRIGYYGNSPITSLLGVQVITKEAEKITVTITLKDTVQGDVKDDVLLFEDGDIIYTFIVQNGNWVLESLFG